MSPSQTPRRSPAAGRSRARALLGALGSRYGDPPVLLWAMIGRSVQPIVEVSSGRLLGTREERCFAFRGVPYAEAPVGSRRLLPPSPPNPWAGVREALEFGPAAPQHQSDLMQMTGWNPGTSIGENCLSLNVWTPGLDNERRPVLVWIHGGAFTIGAGSQGAYDGTRLCVDGDVVVVTLNYRLGALGFLSLEALRTRDGGSLGNFGIQDQVRALTWVQENISAFGGDPNQVTVFGESAGATSVSALFAAPTAEPLFQKAIVQSGHGYNVSYEEAMIEAGERFMRELELAPTDVKKLLDLPVEAILDAQARYVEKNPDGYWAMAFQPVVDGDFLTDMPADALRKGSGSGKALLAGTNLDEMKLYLIEDPGSLNMTREDLLGRMDRVLASPDHAGRDESTPLVETYRQEMPDAPVHELWWAMETDRRMRIPCIRMVERFLEHSDQAFMYLFDWSSPAFGGIVGSCHTLEIPFVFGTIDQSWAPPLVGEGEAVQSLARLMQESWIHFARDGKPGSTDFDQWPAYRVDRRETAVLGSRTRIESRPLENRRTCWDTIPDARDRWTRARIAGGAETDPANREGEDQ